MNHQDNLKNNKSNQWLIKATCNKCKNHICWKHGSCMYFVITWENLGKYACCYEKHAQILVYEVIVQAHQEHEENEEIQKCMHVIVIWGMSIDVLLYANRVNSVIHGIFVWKKIIHKRICKGKFIAFWSTMKFE